MPENIKDKFSEAYEQYIREQSKNLNNDRYKKQQEVHSGKLDFSRLRETLLKSGMEIQEIDSIIQILKK